MAVQQRPQPNQGDAERVADHLAGVALKPQFTDWQDDYLTNRETDQDESLEALLAAKKTSYLD
jgi:hypothetical protein